jgi:hypothetical protein
MNDKLFKHLLKLFGRYDHRDLEDDKQRELDFLDSLEMGAERNNDFKRGADRR